MFGIALKTCINCCCFLKKKITATLNFHMIKTGMILEWHSQNLISFFFETVQYTLNIRINNYIHNMRGNNRQ